MMGSDYIAAIDEMNDAMRKFKKKLRKRLRKGLKPTLRHLEKVLGQYSEKDGKKGYGDE